MMGTPGREQRLMYRSIPDTRLRRNGPWREPMPPSSIGPDHSFPIPAALTTASSPNCRGKCAGPGNARNLSRRLGE
ncbi:protein of unknown function [Streptomyces sp. KY70]|nr:protein of unknown function [Streptomyces sp. KY70]